MKIIIILLVAISVNGFAQDSVTQKLPDTNSVVIHKDYRVDLLVQKQIEINELTSRAGRRTEKGFRLMIISTKDRDEVLAAKTKVYTYFPELKAYLWHQSPFYKLKAGNFKDREEAETYQKKMNPYFPNGVFVMNDVIEVKLSKPGEEESNF